MATVLKKSLASVLRGVLRLPFARQLTGRYLAKTVNVIFIHIAVDSIPPHYCCFAPARCDTASLASDLRRLGRQFRFVPLQEAVNNARGREAKPRMAFTIDDGLDFYTDEIIELFRQHGVTPCLFLITKYIDNTDLMWRHKLSAIVELASTSQLQTGIMETWPGDAPPGNAHELLRVAFSLPYSRIDEFARELWEACQLQPLNEYLERYRPYLSWKRIEALRNEGFQFGSHSHSHPAFDLLGRNETLAEMKASKDVLENRLGVDDYYFAYPFGRLPARDLRQEIHRLAGYKGYFGTYGFSRASGKPGAFYHRISTEGSIDSTGLVPLYRAAALFKRIRGDNDPRI